MRTKFTKWIKSTLKISAVLVLSTLGRDLGAQSPYCSAPESWGACGWGTTVAVAIEAVTFRTTGGASIYAKAADGCNNVIGSAASAYAFINSGNSFALSAGGNFNLDITAASTVYNGAQMGIWIDLNRDLDFNDAGEFLNPLTANSGWTRNVVRTIPISIPCTGVSAGITRIRIRANYQFGTAFGATDGCNFATQYGETEDYEVDLQLPTTLSANFVVPTIVYTDYDYTFINTSQAAIFQNEWDVDADGTYDAVTNNYVGRFSVPSSQSKCLKLRANNCLGSDSITRCFTVTVPTQVPRPDFISNRTTVNLFSIARVTDLTDFGPTSWQWEIYDSTNAGDIKTVFNASVIFTNGTNAASKDPQFLFLKSGTYTVCLTAINGVGNSVRFCKPSYITVLPLQDFTLGAGPNTTAEATGRIYDHAGPNANYGNNRNANVDRLLINPCGASQIDFRFSQLRFGNAGDSLFIYAGENAAAPRVAAFGIGAPRNSTVTVMGGAAFITFQSNSSVVDSGFIGTFNAVLGPQTPPVVDFTLPSSGFFGVELDMIDRSVNLLGIPSFRWDVYEPDGPIVTNSYTTKNAKHTFVTSGLSRVCLTVDGCAGSAVRCKTINITVPTTPTTLDFVASNQRPLLTETVTMTTTADKANSFIWSVFPVTATFNNRFAKNPRVTFTASGAYTFTLRAFNTIDSAATVTTIVKDKYVIVVNYCRPLAPILSSDVAISNFKITRNATNLINNTSTVGVTDYSDFSNITANATFGATYTYEVIRPSTVDMANTRVWVDFNVNGIFDASELVGNHAASQNRVLTGTFTVPAIANSFVGKGRIRVSMAYGSTVNTPCGPIVAGEIEDYGFNIANDNLPPTITLLGLDTVYVERVFTPALPNYVDSGATAFDPTEGNITSKIITTTDFEQTAEGIYSYNYCVTDASGNGPICKIRTVFVVKDRTAPILTLNGSTPMTIDVDNTYVDPGATASDNVDGNLTPSIVVTGVVNTAVVGTYVVTYAVQDVQGNSVSTIRTVNVVDRVAPVITAIGTNNIQINTIWADQTVVSDNYYNGIRAANTVLVATPTVVGLPNTTVRNTYPVTYTATDGSGNNATAVIRNYKVDDFIPPVIDLKTFDTVYHRVNTPYNSIAAQVSDNFYASNQVSLAKTGSVDAFTLGTYTEVYTATDLSGNTATRTRFVKVIDDLSPVLFAPAINGCGGYPIDNMEGVQITDNYDAPAALRPRVTFLQSNVNIHLAGIYTMTYQVTDFSGNVSSPFTRTVNITYCLPGAPVSVESLELSKNTTVYPNPSNGTVNVKVANATSSVTVTVYNAIGTEIAQTQDANGNEISINLNNQAAGIYLVKITSAGQTTTQKVTLTK